MTIRGKREARVKREARILMLHRCGRSVESIAEELGLAQICVRRFLLAHGCMIRANAKLEKRIVSEYRCGRSVEYIADSLDLQRSDVRRILQAAGFRLEQRKRSAGTASSVRGSLSAIEISMLMQRWGRVA